MRLARLLVLLASGAADAQSLTGVAERLPPPQQHMLAYVHAAGPLLPLGEGGRTELEFGDVNGDGHPDLVCVGDHGSPHIGTQQHGLMTWLGDGAGGFSVLQVGDFGYGGVALGDVNGDGLMDAAWGVHHDYADTDLGDQLIEVALGDGTGAAWTPWDDGLGTHGETYGMFGTDLGDVDSDGDLDLGSDSFGCCAGVHVYLSGGDGTWAPSWGFTGGNSNMDFLFADFDGNGRLDIATANSLGTVWLGDGAGGFAAADGNLPASNWNGGLAAGDVTGDGRDELAFVSAGVVQVWSWSAGHVWTAVTPGLGAGAWQAVQLLDLDVDGTCDLLVFGQGQVAAFRGDGEGGWVKLVQFAMPGGGAKLFRAFRAGADIDHNGYPDFAVVQDEGDNRTHVVREASVATQRWLRVTSPTPGRVWRAGQVRWVEWLSARPPGAAAGSVTVELSLDGPGGPYAVLAAGLPDNGRAQITVPAGAASQHAFVRVTVAAPGSTLLDLAGPLRVLAGS
jgi:FG-GAP-like repeat